MNKIKYIFTDYQQYILLSTGYILLFDDTKDYSFRLQEPSLDITLNPAAPIKKAGERIAVTAVSTNFAIETSCTLNLRLRTVPIDFRGVEPTGNFVPLHYEFDDIESQDLYLDYEFVGPDLLYAPFL